MTISRTLALTFAVALIAPLAAHAQAAGETTPSAAPVHHHHRHRLRHGSEQPAVAAPVVAAPFGVNLFAPRTEQKDSDGLILQPDDPDDCNKGCLELAE